MTNRQQRFLHTGDFVHKRHVGQGGQLIDLFVTFFWGGGGVNGVKLLICAISWDHACKHGG